MPYTDLNHLTELFGAEMLVMLTDRADAPRTDVDTDVVDRAIADAGAMIDGYLSSRYTLPVQSTPPLLAQLAAAIAIYKLHPGGEVPPRYEADYKAAIKSLEGISAGRINLPLPTGGEAPGSGGTGARATDRKRPLTADKMGGFI